MSLHRLKKLVALTLCVLLSAGPISYAAQPETPPINQSEKTQRNTDGETKEDENHNKTDVLKEQPDENGHTEKEHGTENSDQPDSSNSSSEKEKDEKKESDDHVQWDNTIKNASQMFRIKGENRIETALEISRQAFSQAETVIIADANGFADALSGSVLSEGRAPLFLIQKALTDAHLQELTRLKAKKIYLLGGRTSIPDSVVQQLTQNGILEENIHRFSGKDRYETSLAIARFSGCTNYFVADGRAFPDALSASPVAYLKKAALILTRPTSDDDRTALLKKGSSLYLIGGPSSVDGQFLPPSSGRISGPNRYATARILAEQMPAQTVILASGVTFPDALSCGPLAMLANAPILLTASDTLPKDTRAYFESHRDQIKHIVLVGGQNSIHSAVEKEIAHFLEHGTWPAKPPEPTADRNLYQLNGYVRALKDTRLSDTIAVPASAVLKVLAVDEKNVTLSYQDQKGLAIVQDFGPAGDLSSHIPTPYISQLRPVYAPVGCEPTAMLMGLKAKGYASVVDLRQFLDRMPKHPSNPAYGFAGSPYVADPRIRTLIDPVPLARYAQNFGPVVDYSGHNIDDIIMELANGNPVLIYMTMGWRNPLYGNPYQAPDGSWRTMLRNNHAVLLIGYQADKNVFEVADPYNSPSVGGQLDRAFIYFKPRATVEKLYNIRHFSIVVR